MHGRRYYKQVREVVKAELLKNNVSQKDAHEKSVTLPNAQIDDATLKCGIKGAIGDGSLRQWLKDHQAELLAIGKFLASILLALMAKEE